MEKERVVLEKLMEKEKVVSEKLMEKEKVVFEMPMKVAEKCRHNLDPLHRTLN